MQVTHPIQPSLLTNPKKPIHPVQPAQVNTTNSTYETDCKILKLIITEELLLIHNTNSNNYSKARSVILATGEDQNCFLDNFQSESNDYKSISKNYKLLEIFLKTLDIETQTTKLISIPPLKNQEKILNLLQNSRPHIEYCCVGFAMDMFDQYSIEKTNHIYAPNWLTNELIDESNLKTGDLIWITSNDSIGHFAIYLSNKLYISLGGSAGPIMITTLEEMENIYNGRNVLQLTLLSIASEKEKEEKISLTRYINNN